MVPGRRGLLSCKYLGRPIASLGWQWGQTRYQIFSYLIPLGYSTFRYSMAWLTGIAALNPNQTADAFSLCGIPIIVLPATWEPAGMVWLSFLPT